MKKAIIIGSGLGGLATALRLSSQGYGVTILEKYSSPGGRLNQFKSNGFTFDLGPSFMSMSYELNELFSSCGIRNPINLQELDPLYQVFFESKKNPFKIWKDLNKLAEEFKNIEPNLAEKAAKYLNKAGEFFNDTEKKVIKSNYKNTFDYLLKLTGVPLKHLPFLYRKMWDEAEKYFESNEVRIIFTLVAFFLGSTPFKTPAIYSLLNYTEMQHDGYWKVEGGMYTIVEEIVKILYQRGIDIVFNTEVHAVSYSNGKIKTVIDRTGKHWKADLFISNSDAAAFRGKVLGREQFSEKKLDKMEWTLAPFTIYLGVKGKIDNLIHHNYFLRYNFKEYADDIFTSSASPSNPYYYVNVASKTVESCAPKGCENLFILCPVPDRRYKNNWDDKDEFADNIISDLSERIGFDIKANILVKKILTPVEWESMFNLYRGSGLGLAHGISQVGGFRPKNKDEQFSNLYYVGASTTPGTGLPMVIISSKLVAERIRTDYGSYLS